MRRINLEVHFAASSIVFVMFNLVRSVTLYASKTLKSAHKCCISLFPAVFTLEDSWVYVCSSYSCNIVSDIKTSVNKTLGFCATLSILYIYPDNSYVQFQRHFDDLWFKHKKDIIKDMICVNLMMDSTILELIGILAFFKTYEIPIILR